MYAGSEVPFSGYGGRKSKCLFLSFASHRVDFLRLSDVEQSVYGNTCVIRDTTKAWTSRSKSSSPMLYMYTCFRGDPAYHVRHLVGRGLEFVNEY